MTSATHSRPDDRDHTIATIIFWAYALLKQLLVEHRKTGTWGIDWLVHGIALACALSGITILPLWILFAWWAGLIALAIYVLPLIIFFGVVGWLADELSD